MVIELADHPPFARDLSAGGVFVPACELRLTEECDLVVCGLTHQMVIPARVVYVDPRGAGLELLGFTPEMKAQLAELAAVAEPVSPLAAAQPSGVAIEDEDLHSGFTEPVPLAEAEELDDDLEIPSLFGRVPEPEPPVAPDEDLAIPVAAAADDLAGEPAHEAVELDADDSRMLGAELEAELGLAEPAPEPADDASLELDLIDPMLGLDEIPPELRRDHALASAEDNELFEDGDDGAEDDGTAGSPGKRARFARNVHERLRGLTLAQQVKLAAQGELHERIVLERLYGKHVWEPLLRNPRLTAPEVARIARMGSLPRILLEILVANNAWLQIPEVRRALLSNPRLATDQIVKVLRLTPKHELKLASIQTAYPYAVRAAAKMLLRGD